MGELVDWKEEVGNRDSKNSGGIKWMKIENGKEHLFRPVGKPIRFYRHTQQIDGRWQRIIVDNRDENILKEKYDIDVQCRFAMNIIDRADGELKLYEFPTTVYNELVKFRKYSKCEPGGSDGSDISMVRTGVALNTKYKIDPADQTSFTDEEKDMIRKNIYKLQDIFKSTSEEKIEELLGSGSTETVQASTPDPDPVVAPVEETPVDNFDEELLGF